MDNGLKKLSEVDTTDSLNSTDNFIVEQDGEIKRVPIGSLNSDSENKGYKITDYGYFGASKNRPAGLYYNYYSFFDLEGNEVDLVDVVKALNEGIVRYTDANDKNGRKIATGYFISEPFSESHNILYVNGYEIGQLPTSFTDIFYMDSFPGDYTN